MGTRPVEPRQTCPAKGSVFSALRACVAAVMISALASSAPAAAEPAQSEAAAPPAARLVKIILIGDSTLAPRTGWGGAFCDLHTNARVACLTMGQGGRSTRTYRSEGFWQQAMAETRIEGYQTRYVLIQLGQNDTFADPSIGTSLDVEYPRNLEAFVDEVRAAGGRVILLTPVAGRQFRRFDLINGIDAWAAQMRTVAARKDVPLVDVNGASAALYRMMGPVKALEFELAPPTEADVKEAETGTTGPQFKPSAAPPPPEGPKYRSDYIHLNRRGAEAVASLVAQELLKVLPELKGMVLE